MAIVVTVVVDVHNASGARRNKDVSTHLHDILHSACASGPFTAMCVRIAAVACIETKAEYICCGGY